MAGAQPLIELLGERLEVDIGGVHEGVKLLPRRRVNVACCDRHVLDPAPARHLCNIHGIFQEDDGVIIGVGDGARARGNRGLDNIFRRGCVLAPVELSRFGDVPVLAELAGQVAPGGTERQHGSSGQIVVQWLLLYWIDTESRGAAVGRKHDPVILPATHKAQAALAFAKPAIARADIALDTPVFEPVPVAARKAFQTLGFGHGIRRVDRWVNLSPLLTGMTESCATMSSRARLRARAPAGIGSFYSLSADTVSRTVDNLGR